jgi:hypothetical protein
MTELYILALSYGGFGVLYGTIQTLSDASISNQYLILAKNHHVHIVHKIDLPTLIEMHHHPQHLPYKLLYAYVYTLTLNI